ncbi:hydrophobic surface binding protein A-domain-containing protein [Pseudomassariella vexata]|uniref:Hydrophobic surface binding protein A-domain-containing protein n=1 Tax=Pseudomassariella vexata TaxID=1141098 RepID=A0A1Y2DHY0_9PEZI|nr:hydrophobic surface binding protein A-domain-containing protein [Pseudomassariella vexata]ORY58837.1 hydrophobic surface binding protein A-domain-containing protein [Pseudomassariella vexata]
MKSATILVEAALVAVALAQLATFQSAIGTVSKALTNLDTAVKSLDAKNPNSAAPVLQMSDAVQTALKQATTQIQGSQTLSLTDALGLQNTATDLTTTVQSTVGDLVSKKPVLDQLGVTSVAVSTLQKQQSSSKALGDAIVSKVPAIGQGIAQSSIDDINNAIKDGVTKLQAPPAAGAGAAAGGAAGGASGGTGTNTTTTTTGAGTAANAGTNMNAAVVIPGAGFVKQKMATAGAGSIAVGDFKWVALIAAALMFSLLGVKLSPL